MTQYVMEHPYITACLIFMLIGVTGDVLKKFAERNSNKKPKE